MRQAGALGPLTDHAGRRASAYAGAQPVPGLAGGRLAESLCAGGADRVKIEYTVVPVLPRG
jgi:hypothetical protein